MRVTAAALCILVALVTTSRPVEAQSVGKILERYASALGGKKIVEQIVSTEMSGRVTATDGRTGVFTQRATRPQRFSVSLSLGDVRWRSGFNGRASWRDDSVEGVRTLYGPEASRVRADALYAATHFVVPEKLSLMSLSGREQVRGREVLVLNALTVDGTPRTLFFDANSYLLVKDAQTTDAGVEERFFDDYRVVDHVLEPHRIEWHRNGETLRIEVERVTHNAPLDGAAFDVPITPTDPPLNIDAVLSAARDSDLRSEDLRASYGYTQAWSFGKIDQEGRVTHADGPAFQIYHLGGRPFGRLIRKMGGEVLSEAERKREDERVQNVVREYERQRASGHAAPGRTDDSGWLDSVTVKLPAAGVGWYPGAASFPAYLRMSDFSNVRRERLGGRTVVVLEFQPKRDVAPASDQQSQIRVLAGALWVDEASQHVMLVESYFLDDFDRTVKGSSLRTELTLVNGEVWLLSRQETHSAWTFVFGKVSRFFNTVEYADHKKFTVETDTTVTLPDAKR